MRMRTVPALLAGVIWLSGAGLADAQPRWGRGPTPGAGACFYRDARFNGEYFCVAAGERVPRMPGGMNDGISSIRIFGRASVVVYRDVRFEGQSARFDTDVRNLQREGWNDQISSIQVTRGEGGDWEPGRPPRWGREGEPGIREGACFFKDSGFRGERFCVPRGASYAQLPPGFNDQISSIRVMGAGVMIFQDGEFGGTSQRIDRDVPNLEGFWNDRISSFRVY
jgi:hypothetical protein